MMAQTPLLGGLPIPATRRCAVASWCSLATAIIGATFCLFASAAAAQQSDRQEPWWRSPAVRSQIALTSQQTERIETIYRVSLPERRRLRQQATTLRNELEARLAVGTMSDDQAVLLIGRLCTAEKQRNVARTMMLLRMHRILTPAQRQQLADLSVRSPGSSTRAASPALAFFQP
jgi:Spy/CpxP family protein refolding chaperone